MRNWILVAALIAASAATVPLSAQSIDAGMNREQVMARLGPVVAERTVGARSYLFYRNGCEAECGTHDVVILENGVVVDAIFRSSYRRYTGKSSSPVALPARGDSMPAPVAPPPKGGFVTGASVISVPPSAPPGVSASKDTTKAATPASSAPAAAPAAPPTGKEPVSEGGAAAKPPADTKKPPTPSGKP